MFALPKFSFPKPELHLRHVVIALSLVFAVLFADQSRAQEADSSKAVKIDRVEEVIENWSPDQHLYVKGDVGASDEQLGKLEKWLDTHGPHWTVVLMNNARDEFYSAPDGERFRGMDAVEFALAHRLANQTEFGELVHEKTGESSGAVFVLYLSERKFAYYSTDVYDRRGLGQSRWVGNLDREVIRAMRSGDRIIDAVKNSVTLIEGRLEKQINKEILDAKLAKERVRIERTRDLENLKSLVNETETILLPRVEESAREIRTKYADAAKSELAQPPLEQWRTKLMNLRKEAENPNFLTADLKRSKEFRDAKTGIQKIRAEINRFLDSYAAHRAFDDMINPVEARLDWIADHPSGVASQMGVEAYRLLDEARSGHARGEIGFAANIEQAVALVEEGEQAIQVEQLRLKTEADRKQLIRRTVAIVAICLAALFLVLLWILNIRRRPALRRAHSLFEKRSKAIENEIVKIDELVAKSEEIIGTPESFAEQKYRGQTLSIGNETHQRIANLKDISAEALREIGSCYELLHPSNPIAEATNMFTSARYEHCLNQLNGKTLHVPGRVAESGDVGEPFWISFDEVVTELHDRKQVVHSNLGTLGNGFSQVKSRMEELQSKINLTTDLEKKLSRAARLDRYFKIPSLFERLLPSAQSDCDRAASIADSDPIQAISEHLPVGLRKVSDALEVINTIEKAREAIFPQLEDAGKELKKLGFDNRWIAERVEESSDRSNEILANAADRPVADQVAQFSADVTGLGLRVRRSCELGNEILNVVEPELQGLQNRISEARKTIAAKLGIDPSKALREDQYDPDIEIDHARQQLQSARAAINYGGVESVMESLEVLEIESNQAEQLIESSLASLNEFESNFALRNQTLDQLASRLPGHQSEIESIKHRFADSAMTLRDQEFVAGSWDVLEPEDDSPTVDRVLMTCTDLLENSRKIVASAHENHFSGRILEAANSLALVEDDLECIEEMFGQIENHCKRIDQLAMENAGQLKNRRSELESLAREVEDDRTQHPTIQQHSDLENAVTGFGIAFENGGNERDPFGDLIQLSQFEARIADLAAALKSDRNAFEEASRAVGGAEAELATANQLAAQSVSDRIPDSRTISQCVDEVENLKVELAAIKKRLKIPHDNWHTVCIDATQLNSKLGVISGRMRQELELAQQAVQVLTAAADVVYEAANWRGSYGIVVVGNPGSAELEEARRKLNQGNYTRSLEFSKLAKSSASNAMEQARRQVDRHRRQVARRAAEARRRRESLAASLMIGSSMSNRRSSRHSSFGSGFGSSFGSSSRSRSSSISSGRSSSSSRSSGFSRSKW